MTQGELARKAGLTQPAISNIENGRGGKRGGEPGFHTVVRIALVLGLPLEQIAADIGLWPARGGKTQNLDGSDLDVAQESAAAAVEHSKAALTEMTKSLKALHTVIRRTVR